MLLLKDINIPDWRTLTQEELDKGLNNGVAVLNSGDLLTEWTKQSTGFLEKHNNYLNLSYGPRERNQIDFIKAEKGKNSVLVFIHGGYWQKNSKETYANFAAGPISHGIHVAIIEYTLAPDVTLDEIVAEINMGINFLNDNFLSSIGIHSSQIVVAGSSAGGHLTAMAMLNPNVKGGIGISGLYDLEPIRNSYLNLKLKLDHGASIRNSPLLNASDTNTPLTLVVGSDELPLLRKQTADFAAYRAKKGLPVHYEEIQNTNHFTILHELSSPTGRITMLIKQLFNL